MEQGCHGRGRGWARCGGPRPGPRRGRVTGPSCLCRLPLFSLQGALPTQQGFEVTGVGVRASTIAPDAGTEQFRALPRARHCATPSVWLCVVARARSDAQSCRPAARRGLPHCVAAPSLGRAAGAQGMKWGGFQGMRMGYGLRWTAGGVGGGGGGGFARIKATQSEQEAGMQCTVCVCGCVWVCVWVRAGPFGPLGGHQLSSRAGQGCRPRRGLDLQPQTEICRPTAAPAKAQDPGLCRPGLPPLPEPVAGARSSAAARPDHGHDQGSRHGGVETRGRDQGS